MKPPSTVYTLGMSVSLLLVLVVDIVSTVCVVCVLLDRCFEIFNFFPVLCVFLFFFFEKFFKIFNGPHGAKLHPVPSSTKNCQLSFIYFDENCQLISTLKSPFSNRQSLWINHHQLTNSEFISTRFFLLFIFLLIIEFKNKVGMEPPEKKMGNNLFYNWIR